MNPKLLNLVLFFFYCFSNTTIAQTIISNVNVVDVEKGAIIESQTIYIKDDKIVSILPYDGIQIEGDLNIDGTDKYLIPGLWDMHTHYNWNYSYATPLLLAHGITGIREMWGVIDSIKMIRKKIANEEMLGPDIYSAGVIIDGKPQIWPGSVGVGNAEEARAEVKKQIKQGVDFFKVYSLLNRQAYYAIVDESKKSGIPFAGHIPGAITFWEAIEAGQQSAEHLYGLLEVSSSQPEILAEFSWADRLGEKKMRFVVETFDKDRFDSLKTVLANSETWLCPTLTVLRSIANLDDPTLLEDPRMGYMPGFFRQMWDPRRDFRFQSRGKAYYEASRTQYKLQLSLMGELADAGVKIIAGTDYPNPFCYPGFSLHDELQLMVEGGMSSKQALQTATINPAIFMDKEAEFGTIEVGKTASLVLLNADPLADIKNTTTINAVFLRGKYLDNNAVEDLLEKARRYAALTDQN